MTPAEDEFTELVDADIPRVDLVDKAANGTRFLIAKNASGSGLLDPALVRELLGTSEQPPPGPETVTMTGSPAAIAKMIHDAALRSRQGDSAVTAAAEPADEQVLKAKYDADDLRRMAASGQAMRDESYPIADHEDLTRAIRAVGRGGADHGSIRRHIIARAKALGAASEIPDNWNSDGSLTVAKAMEPDDGTDGMDPTVIMAEPAGTAPGNPTTPGSPAWEAIDAATARKWTGILARAKAAIDLLADREMMEAASGADPDDADQAYDLQDACCAIDYAISVLAPFAVAEQAEADCGEEMAAVGKALAGFDTAPLDTIEALASITKAGRVLSASNEAAIRGAVEQLTKVLASLPAPISDEESGRPVAKTAHEEPDMPQPTPSDEATEAAGQEPAMGAAEPTPKPVAGLPVTALKAAEHHVPASLAKGLEPDTGTRAVAKDGDKEMVAVYDAKGKLVGIVAPEKITRIAGADSDTSDDTPADSADGTGAAGPETTDLQPAPAAEVGTPADAVPDDDVTKQTTNPSDTTPDAESSTADVAKRLDDYSATQEQVNSEQSEKIAKQDATLKELAEAVELLKGQVRVLEEQPAVPHVFTNGAVPPPHMMRGQDNGAPPVDVAKAQQLKKQLYRGPDAGEQNAIHGQLNEMAIAALQSIHQGGARP